MIWLKAVVWPAIKTGFKWVAGLLKALWDWRVPSLLVLIAVVIAFSWLFELQATARELRELRTTVEVERKLCADVNRRNLDTIETMQVGLRTCLGQNEAIDRFAKEAERTRDRLERALEQERAKRAQARETLYASDADCTAIRDVGVCSGIAERLHP